MQRNLPDICGSKYWQKNIANGTFFKSCLIAGGKPIDPALASIRRGTGILPVTPIGLLLNGTRLSPLDVSGKALAAGFAQENVGRRYRWRAPLRSQIP